MNGMKKILQTDNSYSWLILRIILGVVMGAHGVQKTFGWFNGPGWNNTIAYFSSIGLPVWLGTLVILIESLGALLLVLGFAGRINATLMGIVMAGAFFMNHLPNGFYMNWSGEARGEGYEFDILFWGICIVLAINGSGRYSIDNWLVRRTQPVRRYQPVAQGV